MIFFTIIMSVADLTMAHCVSTDITVHCDTSTVKRTLYACCELHSTRTTDRSCRSFLPMKTKTRPYLQYSNDSTVSISSRNEIRERLSPHYTYNANYSYIMPAYPVWMPRFLGLVVESVIKWPQREIHPRAVALYISYSGARAVLPPPVCTKYTTVPKGRTQAEAVL